MKPLFCPTCRRRVIPPKQFTKIKGKLNINCGYPNCKGVVTLDLRDKKRYLVYESNKEVFRSDTITECIKHILGSTTLLSWYEYFKDRPTHIIDTEQNKKTIWSTKAHL